MEVKGRLSVKQLIVFWRLELPIHPNANFFDSTVTRPGFFTHFDALLVDFAHYLAPRIVEESTNIPNCAGVLWLLIVLIINGFAHNLPGTCSVIWNFRLETILCMYMTGFTQKMGVADSVTCCLNPSAEKNYPSVTLTRCLFATWAEPPSFIFGFIFLVFFSSFPGLIFLVLFPFRCQVSYSRSQVSDFIFHISDFGVNTSYFIF